MPPVNISISWCKMAIVLAIVVMEVAIDDMWKEFFEDFVVVRDWSDVLPRLDRMAVLEAPVLCH